MAVNNKHAEIVSCYHCCCYYYFARHHHKTLESFLVSSRAPRPASTANDLQRLGVAYASSLLSLTLGFLEKDV